MRRSSIPRRQHEQILTDERLRHQNELDQVRAKLREAEDRLKALSQDRERLREERNQFEQDRDTHKKAAEKAAAQLESVLAAPVPGSEGTAPLRRRIRQLEKQYDEAVGLGASRPVDSSRWQPGYQDPKQATS